MTKWVRPPAPGSLRDEACVVCVIRREQVMCCVPAGIALTDELLLSFIFYQHAARSVGSSQATVSNLL